METKDIIAQILNIVPSIFQGIVGIGQMGRARRLEEENPRPEAVIAPSIDKMVNYAYGRTLRQDIPGGEIARNEIKGATSAGMRKASEMNLGAEGFGLLGEMVGSEQNKFADIAKTTAQQVLGAESDYMGTLPIKAQEENRVWDWNKAQPYLSAAGIAQRLRESGIKNIYSGMGNTFGSTAEAVSPDFNSTLIYGKDKGKRISDMTMDEFWKWIKNLSSTQSASISTGAGDTGD